MMFPFAFALLAAQQQAPAAPAAAPAPIRPASGGQVGQPPQNSAMRATASGDRQAASVRANPMGMAGMGAGMADGTTNGLTLSAGRRSGGGMSSAVRQQQQQGSGQTSVSITDTGVTQRPPAGERRRR